MLQDNCMFACVHLAQEEGWQPVSETIATHTSFFSAQWEYNSIVLPNNQIVVITYARFMDTNKGGIRNQKEDKIEIETSTPLINDLEISNIFKDKDNKKGNSVTDKFLDKVSQLLVLVGLAAQQIRDVITGQVQASHK